MKVLLGHGAGRAAAMRRATLAALAVAAVAGLQFAIAIAASRRPDMAVEIVAGAVLVLLAVAYPRVLLVLAPVSTMFAQRVGPEALNLSVTDAVGVLAALAALRYVPWRDRRIRLVLGALAIYLGCLAVSLILHHPQRAVLEWGHRGVMVAGSVLVGVAIVRAGLTRAALRLFMVAMSVIAVSAITVTLLNGIEPAYVFGLQKNHAGLLLAMGFLVAFAARGQLAWHRNVMIALEVLMLLGLAATQSRASALGLAAALAIRPILLGRRGNQRAASIGVLVLCLALLGLTAASVQASDLSRAADKQKFNSINSRTDVYQEAIQKVWAKEKLVGGGLRYFRDPNLIYPTPHNLVISEMAEAGLIGLAGLLTLLVGLALALRRSAAPLAVLGAMALVLRVTQGLADIFWVAGPLTIALVFVGMGLADEPNPARHGAGNAGLTMSRRSRVRGSTTLVAEGPHSDVLR